MAKVKYVSHENDANWQTFQGFRDPTGDGWEVVVADNRFWVDAEEIPVYIEFFTKLQKASQKEEN